MRNHRCRRRRSGTTLVELAIVSVSALLLIYGLIVGGTGVFRYQEMAHLAREGARYASTHGGQYTMDGIPARTGVPAVTSNDQLHAYLLPKAVALDASKLTTSISWSAPATVQPNNIPTYLDPDLTLVPPGQKIVQNYVTVTVTYQWYPEVYLFGPMQLTSTSTVAMSY